MQLKEPADLIDRLRTDLYDEIHHYHVFAQLQRFVTAWLTAFLLLGARGPVDGWNALYSTLIASGATAARQVWPLVSTDLVTNFLNNAWKAAGGNQLSAQRAYEAGAAAARLAAGVHPAGNSRSGATQPTTMNSMNTDTSNPNPSDPLPQRAVTSPTLRVPISGPPPTATATQTFTLPPQASGS